MKRILLGLCIVVSLLFGGCAPAAEDYFAPFAGDFEAEFAGEFRGMEIAAVICMQAGNAEGVREATLTFYAPQALAGTVLTRDAYGNLQLTSGEVSISGKAVEGYAPLLSLFPCEGAIHTVKLEQGYTRVEGEGFGITFCADGTPIKAENCEIVADVIRFERK